jgi:hypothetical protein
MCLGFYYPPPNPRNPVSGPKWRYASSHLVKHPTSHNTQLTHLENRPQQTPKTGRRPLSSTVVGATSVSQTYATSNHQYITKYTPKLKSLTPENNTQNQRNKNPRTQREQHKLTTCLSPQIRPTAGNRGALPARLARSPQAALASHNEAIGQARHDVARAVAGRLRATLIGASSLIAAFARYRRRYALSAGFLRVRRVNAGTRVHGWPRAAIYRALPPLYPENCAHHVLHPLSDPRVAHDSFFVGGSNREANDFGLRRGTDGKCSSEASKWNNESTDKVSEVVEQVT